MIRWYSFQFLAARPLPPYTINCSQSKATSSSRLFCSMRKAASVSQSQQRSLRDRLARGENLGRCFMAMGRLAGSFRRDDRCFVVRLDLLLFIFQVFPSKMTWKLPPGRKNKRLPRRGALCAPLLYPDCIRKGRIMPPRDAPLRGKRL